MTRQAEEQATVEEMEMEMVGTEEKPQEQEKVSQEPLITISIQYDWRRSTPTLCQQGLKS